MSSFFDRMFTRNKPKSGVTAKNRLRFVIQYDRINIPAEKLEAMKLEILEVISKYVAVDSERVDIALERRDSAHNSIVAEIPFAQEQTRHMQTSPEYDDDNSGEAD
jgi:cell division topological specificity factor